MRAPLLGMKIPTIAMNDGQAIPQAGLGTWKLSDRDAAKLIPGAIAAGCRLIDTAAIYQNEAGVGEGLRAAQAPRQELFVTTKVWNTDQGRDATLRAADRSLKLLGLDYVDLYLIHWPAPRQDTYVETWKTLIALRERGLARSIGVSNFHPDHLQRIVQETGVTPAANQIELHPGLPQRVLQDAHRKLGIVTEAWSPLAQGELFGHEKILTLARRLGKSPAQVLLRWHIDQGIVVIPKSSSPDRIRENLALFDFVLTDADRRSIDALASHGRVGPDPETFA